MKPLLRKSYNSPQLAIAVILLVGAVGATIIYKSQAAASPPASGGYYQVTAPGTAFKDEATCAAEVRARNNPWEPRPQNNTANHTVPPASYKVGPDPDDYVAAWNTAYNPRVTGNFTGTTDQIFQWAACKWGWSDDLMRAEAITESNWDQSVGGDREPRSNNHCPYDVTTDPCATSYGILQTKWYFHPPGFASNHPQSSYPWIRRSTAFEADQFGSMIRGCYDGMSTYLGNTRGDIWGCIQSWYDGGWTPGGGSYSNEVKGYYNSKPWLSGSSSWADKSGSTGGGDTQAPNASLAAPSGSVSGTVFMTPSVSDNVGVTKVELYKGGTLYGSINAPATFVFGWNTTLQADGAYSFYVKAYDAAGNVGTSSTITYNAVNSDKSAPTAPTNVTATANSSTRVTLNWTKSTDNVGVTTYKISRSTSGGASVEIGSVNGSTTSYVDTTASPGTQYAYSIKAVDAANNQSSNSVAASVTTPAAATAPNVSLTTPTAGQVITTGSVNVAATASDTNNGGSITNVTFLVDGVVANTDTTAPYGFTWTTSNVANGSHIITARATNAAGLAASAQVSVSVQNAVQPPSVPTNTTATANAYNRVTVAWGASTVTGGTLGGYFVQRSTNGGGFTTLGQVGAAVNSYVDNAATASTRYAYQIVAFDSVNNPSAPSSPASVTTPSAPVGDTTVPTAPSGLVATAASTSQVNLTWKASTDNVGVTGYIIYRNGILLTTIAASADPNPYSCPSHPTITKQASAPAAGTVTYICTQRLQWFLNRIMGTNLAIDGWDGNNTNGVVIQFQTKAGLTANGTVDAATWAALEGGGSLSFGDSGLSAGTNYTYWIIATDAAKNLSAPSSSSTTTTFAAVSNGNLTGTITATNSSNPYSCASKPTMKAVSTSPAKGTTNYICAQRIQWFLNAQNNARLTVDGWYGNNTANAVRNYQTKFGLYVDGITGPNTWAKLESLGGTTAPAVGAQITYSMGGSQNIVGADAQGKYTITGLPAGSHSFTFSLPNYASQTVTQSITGGQTATKNITLQRL